MKETRTRHSMFRLHLTQLAPYPVHRVLTAQPGLTHRCLTRAFSPRHPHPGLAVPTQARHPMRHQRLFGGKAFTTPISDARVAALPGPKPAIASSPTGTLVWFRMG